MDGTQDWEIVNDSIPDDLRKEFEEWHDKYVEIVHKLTKQFQESANEMEYRIIWNERLKALWNHEETKIIKFHIYYHPEIGMIEPEKDVKEMSLEELNEFIMILEEGRKNWLNKVHEQENRNVLPNDFKEKNLKRIIKKYNLKDEITEEQIFSSIEKDLKELKDYYIYLKNKKEG
jgi:hypothetical protein